VAQFRFNSWTTDNGLPQNSINDIRQTPDGYLWLTTFDGLVRFDGVRFTVFDKGNSPGISSNRFLRMYEDAQGDLWAGTEEGGVVRYHQGRFTSYGKEQGLPSLNAVYLTDDADGHVVVYLASGEVLRFIDGRFESINPADEVKQNSAALRNENRRVSCPHVGERIRCLGYGSWGTADGLPSLNRIGGDGIDDGHGALWLATTDPALVKIEHRKVAKVFTQRDGLPGTPIVFVTGAHVSLLSKDQRGAFWLTDINTMQSHFGGTNVPEAVSVSGTRGGYEDREGNLWFGSDRGGLFRARQQFITSYSTTDGLTENNIYPIYQARDGVVWIGTTKGLFRYKDGTFARAGETLRDQTINAIAEDQSGRIIVGSSRQAWLAEGGTFKPFPITKTGSILAIYNAPDGTIWFGGDGLVRFKDGVETLYKAEDGLAGNGVKAIIDDGAGGLWIGAFGGLTHYANGKFSSWTERDGLPSRAVRALYRDRDGVLWIGTYDGGLARFKDGELTSYTAKDGLFNNGVFQILEDERGNFWISCNHGIYRVSRNELNEFAEGKRTSINSIGYGKGDGMLNIECNGGRWPAGVKTRDGKFWFPTQDGVAVIDPNAVPVNPQPPPVFVEALLLNNSPVVFDREVQVRPDQENFEIHYTALSYINSENIRFKYKLEGLDRDWIDVGTRRTAYYSQVRPGSYTFRVIAANSDGVWNNDGASVRLTVLPRFYQTWWFQALIVIGLLGLGLAGYRSRVNRLARAHKAQEEFSQKLLASQEQERQRIAAALHDSLGQSLLIIKNRIALAQSEIDEKQAVQERLDELSHSAGAAIEECREIAYNLRPFQLERFGLSKTLRGIFMRIEEVTEIRASTQIDPIDDLLTPAAQVNVYRIVQECANNIMKHSQATEAMLVVRRVEREISLLIQDNGRGFDRQGFANEPSELASGGFGLIGIAERVRLLGGTMEIDSAAGTSLRIRLSADT
jgi:signal transduction histidine kinase/ligand-binding sensor domain-containing protein